MQRRTNLSRLTRVTRLTHLRSLTRLTHLSNFFEGVGTSFEEGRGINRKGAEIAKIGEDDSDLPQRRDGQRRSSV